MWALLLWRLEKKTKPTCYYYFCVVMIGISVGLALHKPQSNLQASGLVVALAETAAVVLHQGGLVPGSAWGRRLLSRNMPLF